MHNDIKDKIWLRMKQTCELSEYDQELYLFGFTQGAILLLNILTSLCIGIILKMFLEVVIYMICFIPLRVFAGGYHAQTQFRCYIMSSFTTAIILLCIRFLQDQKSIWEIVCFSFALFVIWNFAPVADANKPLTIAERENYRKKVRKRLTWLTGMGILFWMCGVQSIATVIEVAICFLAVVLIMGMCKDVCEGKGRC